MLFFVFAFSLFVVLPLVLGSVAILTEHRRKMAEIRARSGGDDRIAALEARIGDLTELVHRQTIALDGLAALPRESARR